MQLWANSRDGLQFAVGVVAYSALKSCIVYNVKSLPPGCSCLAHFAPPSGGLSLSRLALNVSSFQGSETVFTPAPYSAV